MSFLYSYFYLLTLFLALPLSLVILKLRRGLLGRLGFSKRIKALPSHGPLYWFQVASSGEFEQCLPLLDELKARGKNTVLLTYFSPSGEKAVLLEKERRINRGANIPWDLADYSPWDLPWYVRKIVQSLKPKAFIAIHREIWPGCLMALQKEKVKTYLFSTYWPENSRRRFKFLKTWIKDFDVVGTVGDDTALFLKRELPRHNILNIGDSRIDRVLQRKSLTPATPSWKSFFPQKLVTVAASCWSEDFEALKVGIERALAANPEMRLILVPHDPEGRVGKEIYTFFNQKGFPIRYWSSWVENPDITSHLLVNRVGFLAELYQLANLVFVGGSFKSRVHNVLEPAVYGCPILTGPFIWNSNEALEMSKEGALNVCQSPEDLSHKWLQWIHDESSRTKASTAAAKYIQDRKGASHRYVNILLS